MAHNPFKGNRRIISSIAVVVAVLAALGLGIVIRNAQSDKAAEKKAVTTTTGQPADTTTAEVKQVQGFLSEGKTNEATAYVDQQLAKTDITDQQKYDLFTSQGDIAYDKGDYNGAVASYQKAEAVTPGYRATLSAARAAEKANNKEVAIAYYKKAIERMDKSSPLYDEDKANHEEVIKYLGGTL
jgi:tetratricopeptide (TPR) repeat protein